MVAIKLRQLLSLRGTSTSIIDGGSIDHYDDDDNNSIIQDAQDDLAASIANRELLLTAAAMKHTNNNNNNNNNNNSDDSIRVLSNEIHILRDEMRERFVVLEKKFTINCEDNSVDVSMDSKSVYKDKIDDMLEEETTKLVSPVAKDKLEAEDGTEITSNQNKDKVMDDMATGVVKDDKSIDSVNKSLEEDTAGEDIVGEEEEELNVDIINDKKHEERLVTPPSHRVSKRGKRNKLKKQQAKGKRRQNIKNENKSPSSVPVSTTSGYGILTILVTLIKAIPSLLLMRGGKRLYMLLAFIATSYLFKGEMNSFSSVPSKASVSDDIRTSGGSWLSIGSSFIQGVRALEDCPEQYVVDNIDTYEIGSKVKIEEKVYECTETPCGWKIIGTCVGDMFLPSSASAQPTIQTLGVPVHFPSMMPSALVNSGEESNQVEIGSVVKTEDNDPTSNLPTPLLVRVRTHSPMSLGTHFPVAASSPTDDNDDKSPSSSTAIATPQTNPPSVGGETSDQDSTSNCEGSELCGCASVNQADYRGTISTSANGKECMRWDETYHYKPEYWPDAGLEDNNYCRNPEPEREERAFCITTSENGYNQQVECDVPICEDSLPSAYPSSSLHPTTTPKPTTLSPTPGPKCEGSNSDECGCVSVKQEDYRGTISTTASGKECIRWDEAGYTPEYYPDAGLEDNNYCRNPEPDYKGRAWCFTEDGDEECDVPYCFPPKSSCPSTLDVSTNTSSMSEELQAACPYHQCVAGSWGGYELDDYQTLTRAEVKPDCACAFEIWDCAFGSSDCSAAGMFITSESQDLKTANDCCVSKLADLSTSEASCECIIEPKCEAGDSTKCFDFAAYCCADEQCYCEYLTKACRLALESDSEEVLTMAGEYCGDSRNGGGAQDFCCGEDNDDIGLCNCDFWEPLCTDFSNAEIGDIMNEDATTCDHASTACCDGNHCKCDLLTHATETLGYESESGSLEQACAEASNIAPDNEVELQSLQSIYNETGGDYWYNNTGWMSEEDRCNWFGITCDEEGYVIEINLPNNNLTGTFPADSLSSLYKLQRLLLNNNALHGIMARIFDKNADYDDDTNYEEWVTDASLFFNLRDLTYVDLSQNNLSGEVDVLFAPALQYTNFSHNNFTSINSFKKFKRSQQTLTVCDVSHNFINTSATDLMKHVPTNIEQFIMSSNLIHGSLLTSSLEELASLRRFDMSMNSLSGELPDFSNVYPNLQVSDLSDQGGSTGLVGNIPESLANLPFLSTLILGGNLLSGVVPPVLGNMGQLRVFNVSSNKLSQTIPKELGKLGELAHIIYAFFRVMNLILLTCYFTTIPYPSRS